MLPNNNSLYQFGVCLDFKLQKKNITQNRVSLYLLLRRSLACGNLTCKKDVTRCYAALASYGQQFVDEEKGRNSKAILADVMCDSWVSTTTHFIRLGDKIFLSDFSGCILNVDQHRLMSSVNIFQIM